MEEIEMKVRDEGIGTANVATSIVEETASVRNPYLADDVRVHGYPLRRLSGRVSFSEILYLSMRGELPRRRDLRLLDDVLVALSMPGARHPAGRAVMYASVSKTVSWNVLPLGCAVLSGNHLGAQECFEAMKFLARSLDRDPAASTREGTAFSDERPDKIAPGFGSRFGGRDPLPAIFLARFARRKDAGRYVRWARSFSASLARRRMGPLATGLAAAVFLDLGFTPAQGCGIFQLAASPGLIALSAEAGAQGPSAMPFLPDDRYNIISREQE